MWTRGYIGLESRNFERGGGNSNRHILSQGVGGCKKLPKIASRFCDWPLIFLE